MILSIEVRENRINATNYCLMNQALRKRPTYIAANVILILFYCEGYFILLQQHHSMSILIHLLL